MHQIVFAKKQEEKLCQIFFHFSIVEKKHHLQSVKSCDYNFCWTKTKPERLKRCFRCWKVKGRQGIYSWLKSFHRIFWRKKEKGRGFHFPTTFRHVRRSSTNFKCSGGNRTLPTSFILWSIEFPPDLIPEEYIFII